MKTNYITRKRNPIYRAFDDTKRYISNMGLGGLALFTALAIGGCGDDPHQAAIDYVNKADTISTSGSITRVARAWKEQNADPALVMRSLVLDEDIPVELDNELVICLAVEKMSQMKGNEDPYFPEYSLDLDNDGEVN